jgi:hypothetical protein
VSAAGAGSATITATYQSVSDSTVVSVDDGQSQYQSFTAYVEDGYINVGTKDQYGVAQLNECPQGTPADPSESCIRYTASYDQQTGDFTVQPENFHFPNHNFTSETVNTVPGRINTTQPIQGNLDFETGDSSFSTELSTKVLISTGCTIDPFAITGTTGQSGSLTGTTAPPSGGIGEGTLVANEFAVGNATGSSQWCQLANNDIGLPAPAGENEMRQEMYVVFHEEPVSDVTGN